MQPADDLDRAEARLISRVVMSDDHDAFAQLLQMHQSPVRQFLRRLTGYDHERANDLAQEAFWKAYRNIGTYRAEGRFRSWLFRIAYQLFVTEERRNGKMELVELPAEPWSDVSEGDQLVAARTVEQLLGHLRVEERAAIVLHYRHELTQQEVATALEMPLGTVKTFIRRGREKLRSYYESNRPARQT
jgi:RNA polymerase sigma-70 factor (ECF subfamily)